MAMLRKIKVEFGDVFPHGAFAVSSVEPARDFEKSTKDNPVQVVDEDSGLPVWQVDIHDGDPDVRKADREFTVKIAAKVQPVLPPAPFPGMPFVSVELDGLTVTPYLSETASGRSRLAYSFRATGLKAPKNAPSASKPAA
jgi:hypothetical protein